MRVAVVIVCVTVIVMRVTVIVMRVTVIVVRVSMIIVRINAPRGRRFYPRQELWTVSRVISGRTVSALTVIAATAMGMPMSTATSVIVVIIIVMIVVTVIVPAVGVAVPAMMGVAVMATPGQNPCNTKVGQQTTTADAKHNGRLHHLAASAAPVLCTLNVLNNALHRADKNRTNQSPDSEHRTQRPDSLSAVPSITEGPAGWAVGHLHRKQRQRQCRDVG
jgi:hypothetical protein